MRDLAEEKAQAKTEQKKQKEREGNKGLVGCLMVFIGLLVVGWVYNLLFPPGTKVTQAEYGDAWPLTVSEGRVDCLNGHKVIFSSNGKTYGLNGTALIDYPGIEPIWKTDEALKQEMIASGYDRYSTHFSKISITPLRERGQELCGK